MINSSNDPDFKEPILTKNFCFAFIASFCGSFIMYMLVTTISEYAQTFGASKTVAGLVSSIYLIGGVGTRLLFGRLIYRFGWKKMVPFSMIVQLIACSLYFIVSNIYELILIRFVHGCCVGLAASVGSTTGQYMIPKSRYGEGNGILMTSNALAVCVGPLLGGVLYDRYGSTGCFVAALLFALMMAVGIFLARAPYPDLASVRADSEVKRAEAGIGGKEAGKRMSVSQFIEKEALPAAGCIFFCGVAYSCILSFIRLFGIETGLTRAVSGYFVVYAVVLVISRPSAGRIQDRRGDNTVVYPCVIMQILSFLLLCLVPNSATVLIAAALLALGYGTLNSVFLTIACRNVAHERLSYAIVVFWIAIDSSVGVGPVILGAVADSKGYSGMFLCAAIITAIVLPVYYFLCHRRQPKAG